MATVRQVIVVAPNNNARQLVAAMLGRIGLQTVLIKDPAAALVLLKEGLVPSMIIFDLGAAEESGFEMLAQIRELRSLDKVPLLILSEQANSDVIRRGLDIGADAYVTHAFIAHSLLDRVRVLLVAGRRPRARTTFYGHTSPLNPKKVTGPLPE